MTNRAARAIALLMLGAVALAGCGDDPRPSRDTATPADPAPDAPQEAAVRSLSPSEVREQCDGPAIYKAVAEVPAYAEYSDLAPREHGESTRIVGCRDLGADGSLEALVELRGGGAKDVIFRWLVLQRSEDAAWAIRHESLPVPAEAPIEYSTVDDVAFDVSGESIVELRSEYAKTDSSCCPTRRSEHLLAWEGDGVGERLSKELPEGAASQRCGTAIGGEPGELRYSILRIDLSPCKEGTALGAALAAKLTDRATDVWSVDGFRCTITAFGPTNVPHSGDEVRCAQGDSSVDLYVGS